jgi:adenylate cyclase
MRLTFALGNSTEQPNLAASLTEDLTTELSRGGLLVTSRATTSAYLGKAVDGAQSGPELGVRYIVDGSVEQAGSQIRVTARLADVETGAYFWADHYDRATGNVLDLEDEVLGRIVNSIRRALVTREADRPGKISNAARLIWRGSALLYSAALPDNRCRSGAAVRTRIGNRSGLGYGQDQACQCACTQRRRSVPHLL